MSFSSRAKQVTKTGLIIISAAAVTVAIYAAIVLHAIEDAVERKAKRSSDR